MSATLMRATGVLVLFVGTSLIGATAQAEPFQRTFSGWGVATEIDTNGDGDRAGSTTYGSSGTFGQATSNDQTEFLPEPTGFCSLDPLIVEFQYAALTSVTRFQNGDLLLAGLDLDPENPSTLCFNPLDGTFTATLNIVFLGGTGRFEGAMGSATATAGGVGLAGEVGVRVTHSAFSGTTEGEIFLAE